jgi:hypothetical protein
MYAFSAHSKPLLYQEVLHRDGDTLAPLLHFADSRLEHHFEKLMVVHGEDWQKR